MGQDARKNVAKDLQVYVPDGADGFAVFCKEDAWGKQVSGVGWIKSSVLTGSDWSWCEQLRGAVEHG